jgi:hypothetical protein
MFATNTQKPLTRNVDRGNLLTHSGLRCSVLPAWGAVSSDGRQLARHPHFLRMSLESCYRSLRYHPRSSKTMKTNSKQMSHRLSGFLAPHTRKRLVPGSTRDKLRNMSTYREWSSYHFNVIGIALTDVFDVQIVFVSGGERSVRFGQLRQELPYSVED